MIWNSLPLCSTEIDSEPAYGMTCTTVDPDATTTPFVSSTSHPHMRQFPTPSWMIWPPTSAAAGPGFTGFD